MKIWECSKERYQLYPTWWSLIPATSIYHQYLFETSSTFAPTWYQWLSLAMHSRAYSYAMHFRIMWSLIYNIWMWAITTWVFTLFNPCWWHVPIWSTWQCVAKDMGLKTRQSCNMLSEITTLVLSTIPCQRIYSTIHFISLPWPWWRSTIQHQSNVTSRTSYWWRGCNPLFGSKTNCAFTFGTQLVKNECLYAQVSVSTHGPECTYAGLIGSSIITRYAWSAHPIIQFFHPLDIFTHFHILGLEIH